MMRAFRIDLLRRMAEAFGFRDAVQTVDSFRRLARDPEAVRYICAIGHVFEPFQGPNGEALPHDELVRRAARRDMALHLLAVADLKQDEISIIRAERDGYEHDDD